jgi:hypothetical protein
VPTRMERVMANGHRCGAVESTEARMWVAGGGADQMCQQAITPPLWSEDVWPMQGMAGAPLSYVCCCRLAAGGGRKVAVNRLEGHREVCTKTGLAATLARLAAEAPTATAAACPFAPETHVLSSKTGDSAALRHFRHRCERCGGLSCCSWRSRSLALWLDRGGSMVMLRRPIHSDTGCNAPG